MCLKQELLTFIYLSIDYKILTNYIHQDSKSVFLIILSIFH